MKKIISVVLSALMAFSCLSIAFSQTVFADAVHLTVAPVTIKTEVPETIYLKPSDATFQYYVNNIINSDGSVALEKNGAQTVGEYYFYSNYAGVTLQSVMLEHATLSTISNKNGCKYGTISSGSYTGLAENETALVKWTFVYTVSGSNTEYTIYDYSVIYNPFTTVIAAAARCHNSSYYYQSANYIFGIHAYDNSGAYSTISPLTDVFSAGRTSLGSYNNTGILNTLVASGGTLKNAAYNNRDNNGDNKVTGPKGYITIDTSRYTNYSQIPNLKGGWQCTDNENTLNNSIRLYRTNVVSSSATTSNSTRFTSPAYDGGLNNSEGHPLNPSALDYAIGDYITFWTDCGNTSSVGSIASLWNMLYLTVEVTQTDKESLRKSVADAIIDGKTQTDDFKNACLVLGNPRATADEIEAATKSYTATAGNAVVTYKYGNKTVSAQETAAYVCPSVISATPKTVTGYSCNDTAVSVFVNDKDWSYNFDYIPSAYSITYDANGGENAPAVQSKLFDVDVVVTSSVPTKSDCAFAGWNTNADGSGTAYTAGDTYSVNADLVLYAQWQDLSIRNVVAIGGYDDVDILGDTSAFTERSIVGISLDGNDFTQNAVHGTYGIIERVGSGRISFRPTNMKWGANAEEFYIKVKSVFNGTEYQNIFPVKIYAQSLVMFEEDCGIFTDGSVPWIDVFDSASTNNIPSDTGLELYGYSDMYANNTGYSNGSAKKVICNSLMEIAPKYEFEFTGTGFDVMSSCTDEGGLMVCSIVDENGEDIANMAVATGINDSETYQCPVFRKTDLPYGTYKCTVMAAYHPVFDINYGEIKDPNDEYYMASEAIIDSIRIYNPAGNNLNGEIYDCYVSDNELNPKFGAMKEVLLSQSVDSEELVGLTGVLYVDYPEGEQNTTKTSEYKTKGANHEVVLTQNSAVAFQMNDTTGNIQIGLRTLRGEDAQVLVGTGNKSKIISFKNTIEMFYDLTEYVGDDGCLVIKSLTEPLISVGLIKTINSDSPIQIMATEDALVQANALQSIVQGGNMPANKPTSFAIVADDKMINIPINSDIDAVYKDNKWFATAILSGDYVIKCCKEAGIDGASLDIPEKVVFNAEYQDGTWNAEPININTMLDIPQIGDISFEINFGDKSTVNVIIAADRFTYRSGSEDKEVEVSIDKAELEKIFKQANLDDYVLVRDTITLDAVYVDGRWITNPISVVIKENKPSPDDPVPPEKQDISVEAGTVVSLFRAWLAKVISFIFTFVNYILSVV